MTISKVDFDNLRQAIKEDVADAIDDAVEKKIRPLIKEEVRNTVQEEVRVAVKEQVGPMIDQKLEAQSGVIKNMINAEVEPLRKAFINVLKSQGGMVDEIELLHGKTDVIVHYLNLSPGTGRLRDIKRELQETLESLK